MEKMKKINSFIWKGNKVLDENGKYKQVESKMVDLSHIELCECYEHCKTMLFNKENQNPGRYIVLDLISNQMDHCGAELFLRYVEQNYQMSRFSLIGVINEFLNVNKEALKNVTPKLNVLFSGMPNEFEKLPISLILDGALDRLGTFNKKHITRTLILKQGIWLTPAEAKELNEEISNGDDRDRLDIIRERLNLNDVEKLYINSKGLNLTQIRAMLNIKPNKKYADLTTEQLTTLRNRILYNLEETVKLHITSWERRMEELELVAQSKNWPL